MRFARDGTALLKAALALEERETQPGSSRFSLAEQQSWKSVWIGLIARKRYLTDRDNRRFARRLHRHREHLLRFLYVDELDATNNLAERQLRRR